MNEEIRNDVVNATSRGTERYSYFRKEVMVDKTSRLHHTIHRLNLATMINIRNKIPKTTKMVLKEINMTEKTIEVARDRGITTGDLLKCDIIPSRLLFDDRGLMVKPEKSKLLIELETQLRSEDYSYEYKPMSAFIIDVMANVRKMNLKGHLYFSDLLSSLFDSTRMYQSFGRCDYVFDIYNDNPSVKDSERIRRNRCSSYSS